MFFATKWGRFLMSTRGTAILAIDWAPREHLFFFDFPRRRGRLARLIWDTSRKGVWILKNDRHWRLIVCNQPRISGLQKNLIRLEDSWHRIQTSDRPLSKVKKNASSMDPKMRMALNARVVPTTCISVRNSQIISIFGSAGSVMCFEVIGSVTDWGFSGRTGSVLGFRFLTGLGGWWVCSGSSGVSGILFKNTLHFTWEGIEGSFTLSSVVSRVLGFWTGR